MLNKLQKDQIDAAIKDFADFLKDHDAREFTATKEPNDKLGYDHIRPVVWDILLETEKQFFRAMAELESKHSSLTTVEDIATLTQQILKLAK